MSNRATVRFGRALFVPLVLLSGIAAAGPLLGLPTSTITQSTLATPSLAVAPLLTGSLPAIHLSSPASIDAMNVQGSAALPGLGDVTNNQRRQPALRTGTSTNGIRPIRVPPNFLPITFPLPLVTGS